MRGDFGELYREYYMCVKMKYLCLKIVRNIGMWKVNIYKYVYVVLVLNVFCVMFDCLCFMYVIVYNKLILRYICLYRCIVKVYIFIYVVLFFN